MSVVIPTHNGGERTVHVLAGLAAQTLPAGTAELIVIDNASTDGTAERIARDASWANVVAAGVPARIVSESTPGLTAARFRGLREAAAGLVCFLDDDTVPEAGYVAAGLEAMADARVGMLTSRVFPEYEVPPAPAVAKREMMLALNYRLGDEPRDWGATPTVAPTLGAGMWVRKAALARVIADPDRQRLLSDRIGTTLISGGDIELGVLVGAAGFSRRYEPRARLRHRIPASRVAMPYFRRLVRGVVRSHITVTRRYPPRPWTASDRLRAWVKLATAVAALPVLLLRPDGWNEVSLVFAARAAELAGPYRTPEG